MIRLRVDPGPQPTIRFEEKGFVSHDESFEFGHQVHVRWQDDGPAGILREAPGVRRRQKLVRVRPGGYAALLQGCNGDFQHVFVEVVASQLGLKLHCFLFNVGRVGLDAALSLSKCAFPSPYRPSWLVRPARDQRGKSILEIGDLDTFLQKHSRLLDHR